MSKYIEENALIEHLTKMLLATAINNTGYKTYASNVFRDIAVNRLSVWLENAPKADVVEVVRCNDCKYYLHSNEKCELIDTRLHFYETDNTWTEDAFCAWGERREE